MKYTPILFKGAMVRAILAGTKTQTRRIVKPQPTTRITPGGMLEVWAGFYGWRRFADEFSQPHLKQHICPHGAPGDRLWVKETWAAHDYYNGRKPLLIPEGVTIECRESPEAVKTDGNGHRRIAEGERGRWRPSIFMRRWMSRITLELTAVRVEKLNAISEADAKAEGIGLHSDWSYYGAQLFIGHHTAVSAYAALWESINGPGSWAANPWVWVETFRRIDA